MVRKTGRVGASTCRVAVVAAGLVLVSACAFAPTPIERATSLLKQNKKKQAVAVLREAIASEPQNGELYIGLGLAYLALDKQAEAERQFTRGGELGHKPQAALHLAGMRRRAGRYHEAVPILHEALALAPKDASLHYELALVFLAAGDHEKAVPSLKQVTALSPAFFLAYLRLAEALAVLDRHPQAATMLTAALGNGMGLPVAPLAAKLGEIYEHLNEPTDADVAFRRALTAEPFHPVAAAGHARALWAKNRHDKAIDLLRKGIAKHPKAAVLHLELGLALEAFQVPDQAVKSLKLAIKLDAQQARAYRPLIALLSKNGAGGRQLMPVLLKAGPVFAGDIDIQLQLAQVAYDNNDDKTVIAAASRLIALQPAHVEGNYLLGLAQARTGDLEAAQETYEALVVLEPETAEKLLAKLPAPAPKSTPTESSAVTAEQNGAAAKEQKPGKSKKSAASKKKRKKKRKKKKRRRRR